MSDSRDTLLERVEEHSATLKILSIDANPPGPLNGADDILNGRDDTPDSGEAWNFSTFGCLQELAISLPMFFDTIFVLSIFDESEDRTFRVDHRRNDGVPDYDKEFEHTLSNCLPSSLQKLTLVVDGLYQLGALESALGSLLECRAEKFPALGSVAIDLDSEGIAFDFNKWFVRSAFAEVSMDVRHVEPRWVAHISFD